MPRINIPKKYLNQFVDEPLIKKRLVYPGTIPADLNAMRAAIAVKLADRKFLESFVNDVIQSGQVKVTLK